MRANLQIDNSAPYEFYIPARKGKYLFFQVVIHIARELLLSHREDRISVNSKGSESSCGASGIPQDESLTYDYQP
jgi:hypothetical protein